MATMRDIKRRKVSIQSTQQITKAMKLVSTVRLQRAKARAERAKAYFHCMYSTVSSILARTADANSPYLAGGASPKKAVVVISSNRGLAGGFNGNIVKLLTRNEMTADWKKDDVAIYAVGTKGRDGLSRSGFSIVADHSDVIEEPLYTDAQALATELLEAFAKGEVGEIYVAYTGFKNTVVHVPTLMRVLPVDTATEQSEEASKEPSEQLIPMNYEPGEEEALAMIIPKYMASLIYGAMVESVASENGARMQAMDSATSNAEDMIQSLALQYNRARQGSITQELTEIIAGAEAIS